MNKIDSIAVARSVTKAEDFDLALRLWLELHGMGENAFSSDDWYTINYHLGDTFNDLKDNVSSLPYYLTAEKAAPNLSAEENLNLYSRICYDALHAGREDLANDYLERILPQLIAQKLPDYLFNLGQAYEQHTLNEERAAALFKQALDVADKDNQDLIIRAYWALDDHFKDRRQFQDRIDLADRCLNLLTTSEDQLLCHLNALESLLYTTRIRETMERWPATDQYKPDFADYPEMYQSLYFAIAAIVAMVSGDPDKKVRQLIDEALRISRFNDEPIFPMKIAEQSTLFFASVNRHDLAIEYGKVAVAEARKLPEEHDRELNLAELAFNQATNLYSYRHSPDALELLQSDVLPYFDQLPWEAKIGVRSLCVRSAFHLAQGNVYAKYLQLFYKLEHLVPEKLHYNYYRELADLLAGTHRYEDAIVAANRAIATSDPQAHSHTLPYVRKNLAKFYEDLGESDRALAALQTIDLSEVDDDFLSDYFLVLGDTHFSLQTPDFFSLAEDAYNMAVEYAKKLLAPDFRLSAALNNLGRLYNYVGRFQQSLEYYKSSLALDQKAGLATGLAIGYHNIGANYLQLEDYLTATAHLTKALHLRQRRFGPLDPNNTESRYVSDEYNNTIELLVRSLLHEQKVELAYRYALYASSVRSVAEAEAIPDLALPQPEPGQAVLTYVGSRGEVLSCFVHTDTRLEASFVLVDDLSPDLAERLDRFRILTHRPDTRHKNYHTHLPDLCRYYTNRLADAGKWKSPRGKAHTQKIGRKLYEDLIGDHERYLEGCHELLVITDYTLALVPFAALVDREGQWLVSRYKVAYPTIGLQREEAITSIGQKKLLIAGGTSYTHIPDSGLSDLPAGKLEAKAIDQLLPTAESKLDSHVFNDALLSDEASSLLAPYRRLHLIGHAESDPTTEELTIYLLSGRGNYYSVPHRYVGKTAEIVYNRDLVEIYVGPDRVATHERCHPADRGRYVTELGHMPKSHQEWKRSRGFNGDYFRGKARAVGPATEWAVAQILSNRYHESHTYGTCQGVLRLAEKYGPDRLEAAAAYLQPHGRAGYRRLVNVLDKRLDLVVKPPDLFTSLDHENLRGADAYT